MKALLMGLQDSICAGLEQLDGDGRFQEESWVRPEGGGGRSRVLREGSLLEQGGVNFSEVQGKNLPPSILNQRPEAAGHPWYAVGTSMVLHPRNPYIPTVHLNYRYFEAGPVWWFGGGADLTPYYPFLEDAKHFHQTLKGACDSVNPAYYPVFKPWCDEYFFLKHRNETRGIGGIFYDYQSPGGAIYKGPDAQGPAAAVGSEQVPERDWESLFQLASACGNAFLPSWFLSAIGRACSSWRLPVAMPFCPATCRSLSGAKDSAMGIASASSSSTGAAVMWSSTWCSTAARFLVCRPMAALNPS